MTLQKRAYFEYHYMQQKADRFNPAGLIFYIIFILPLTEQSDWRLLQGHPA